MAEWRIQLAYLSRFPLRLYSEMSSGIFAFLWEIKGNIVNTCEPASAAPSKQENQDIDPIPNNFFVNGLSPQMPGIKLTAFLKHLHVVSTRWIILGELIIIPLMVIPKTSPKNILWERPQWEEKNHEIDLFYNSVGWMVF